MRRALAPIAAVAALALGTLWFAADRYSCQVTDQPTAERAAGSAAGQTVTLQVSGMT